ncbi:MAG: hypothetical protein HY775_13245 [Acidobacteria bacterium]|nr:hypothetical protein [Acidobacteriota bacterium]
MSVRKLLLIALVVLAAAAPAFANGPSGSTETDNQVDCTGAPVAGVYLFAGAKGVEACSQGGLVIQGRVIVSAEQGYVAVDGDESNKGMDKSLTGWVRVDAKGVRCDHYTTGEDSDDTDSTTPAHNGGAAAEAQNCAAGFK